MFVQILKKIHPIKFYPIAFSGFFAIFFSIFLMSCGSSQKVDLRTLVPSDSLIYLETKDAAETLESLTASPAFQEIAKDTPDFSALKNVQMAVVITAFGTSENEIDQDQSVLNIQPRFVAAAQTHLWNWQTVSLVENQINNFVVKKLGDTTQLEKSDKDGGNFFKWTASDKRQIFAFVQEDLIFFGNDAAAIEKCLAVKNGEIESLAKNESLNRNYSADNLAFGYISPNGISEIARFAGVSIAAQTNEESDGRNFIARLVPQILQNTTREIFWSANKINGGIEDKFIVTLTNETSAAMNKNFIVSTSSEKDSVDFLPSEIFSATRYNLKNPLEAWQTLLALTSQSTDALSGNLLKQVSNSLLEPYEISSAEMFLNSIETEIITAQFDENYEKSVVIADVKNVGDLKKSIAAEINFNSAAEKFGDAEIWFSKDKSIAAAFVENKLILGDSESVLKCLQAKLNNQNSLKNQRFEQFSKANSIAATFGKDADSADKIAGILAGKQNESTKLLTFYLTETRLNENGFERKTISDFGFIGTILKQTEK